MRAFYKIVTKFLNFDMSKFLCHFNPKNVYYLRDQTFSEEKKFKNWLCLFLMFTLYVKFKSWNISTVKFQISNTYFEKTSIPVTVHVKWKLKQFWNFNAFLTTLHVPVFSLATFIAFQFMTHASKSLENSQFFMFEAK